jgi:hypothetical protein
VSTSPAPSAEPTNDQTPPGLLKRAWWLMTWPVRTAVSAAWCVLGLWTALAVYFNLPASGLVALGAALGIMGLFVLALREKWLVPLWRRQWRALPLTLASLVVWVVVVVGFLMLRPDPNLDWAEDHARHPRVTITGDTAVVQNVRNFAWRTAREAEPIWEERRYDLSKLQTMYYVIAPMFNLEGVAHVFVCFSFSDGQHVAISVEARRQRGMSYRPVASMFRQYQLIYVIGDERDVVGLRGVIWRNSLRFYPASTPPARVRAIFESMLRTGDQLNERPEFYHLLTNNCLTNITRHIRKLGGTSLPRDLALALTGLSDRVAFELGYIDTDLPFEAARRVFTIDDWMRSATLDEDFSKRLREHLRTAAAEASKAAAMNPGK